MVDEDWGPVMDEPVKRGRGVGNPNWVAGGPSPNPGGRKRTLVEIERMLDAEFRDVESMRENFTRLRDLALNGVVNEVYTKDGALCGRKVTHHPAYLAMLLDRTIGPVKDLEIDLSDAKPEHLEYLREKLRQ